MRLLALLLISASCFASMAGRFTGHDMKSKVEIQKANFSGTANLTNSSVCISGIVGSFNAAQIVGQAVTDFTNPSYVPAGTTVVASPGTCAAGQIQMSQAATHAATGDSLGIGGTLEDLTDDNKIVVHGNGLDETLYDAMNNGDIGSGGLSDYGALLNTLYNLKHQLPQVRIPNQILDTFLTSNFGTYSNVAALSGGLQLTGSNLTGSYERERPMSPAVVNLLGVLNMDLQALAPAPIAITSNQITFQKDVTPYLTSGSTVVIAKEYQADSELQHKYLMDSKVVAQLSVTSAVYNSGLDRTVVTLSNPNSLDLTMGLSSSNFPANLRVIPFNYSFQAKTDAGQSYSNLTVVDAATTGVLKIPGQNYALSMCGYTGSVFRVNATKSSNGQYILIRALENVANPKNWSWCYSSNYGVTFQKFATVKSNLDSGAASDYAHEMFSNATYNLSHDGQLVCSNNGKCFSTYGILNASSVVAVKGVYMDLSVGSPAITDTPAVVDTYNDTATAGYIFSSGVHGITADVTANSDLSRIAVVGRDSNNVAYIRWFTAGGSVNSMISSATYAHPYTFPTAVEMDSSGRTILFHGGVTIAALQYHYWDSSSNVAVGGATVTADDTAIVGSTSSLKTGQAGSRVHLVYRDVTHAVTHLVTGTFNASPALTDILLSNLDVDILQGDASGTNPALHRAQAARVVTDPTNDKHLFIALDALHSAPVVKAMLFEVADTTNMVGYQINNGNTGGVSFNLNDISARAKIAQTFTPVNSRIRTVEIRGWTVGTLPANSTITATIEGTAGGVCNGVTVATASAPLAANTIGTSTLAQRAYFNFNASLSTSSDYCFILTPSYPTSASNYFVLDATAGALSAGEKILEYTGAGWVNLSTTQALTIGINTEWLTDVGYGLQASVSPFGVRIDDALTGISLINGGSTAQVISRPGVVAADAYRPYVGFPYRRALTIGNGSAQSVLTAGAIDGYSPQNFDAYAVFETHLGTSDYGQIDPLSGATDNTKLAEDRSGQDIPSGAYTNIVFSSDVNMGTKGTLNGTNSSILYDDSSTASLFKIGPTNGFYMVAQIRPSSVGGGSQRDILTFWNASSLNRGFIFAMNSAGFLTLQTSSPTGSSAAATTASDQAEPTTCHYVAVWDDGSATHLGRSASCSSPTIVEVASYSIQQRPIAVTANTSLAIGTEADGANAYGGDIGCVKMLQGSYTPVYVGCMDQSAFPEVHNLGSLAVAWNKTGTNSHLIDTNFNDLASIASTPNDASVVDSYEDQFAVKNKLPFSGSDVWVKLNLGRVSIQDGSKIDSFNFRLAPK